MARVPRLHPDVGVARVGDRLIASGVDDVLHRFEDAAGEVSEVAERIVELADGKRTLAEIIDVLCDEFEVGPARCKADTATFVTLLVDRGILVWT